MTSNKRIPSLDGLRAVSITLVLLSHSYDQLHETPSTPVWRVVGNGPLGVSIFFVISGYLITTLLVRELDGRGRIDLRDFYVKRAFRILPACYTYLGVVLALMLTGVISEPFVNWMYSFLFLRNYATSLGLEGGGWYTAHYWSLAVEEQFYIFWPVCLALLGRTRGRWLAIGLIAVSPVSRVLTYFALTGLRGDLGAMTHTRLDTLMFGCLAALLAESGAFRDAVRKAIDARLPWIALLFVALVSPVLTMRFQGVYLLTLGYSIEGACITLIMLWLIDRPASFAGKVMNQRAVAHLGVISYSFYLWQQMFCGLHLPWSVGPTLIMAEGSYWLIERPCLRMRARFLRGGSKADVSVDGSPYLSMPIVPVEERPGLTVRGA